MFSCESDVLLISPAGGRRKEITWKSELLSLLVFSVVRNFLSIVNWSLPKWTVKSKGKKDSSLSSLCNLPVYKKKKKKRHFKEMKSILGNQLLQESHQGPFMLLAISPVSLVSFSIAVPCLKVSFDVPGNLENSSWLHQFDLIQLHVRVDDLKSAWSTHTVLTAGFCLVHVQDFCQDSCDQGNDKSLWAGGKCKEKEIPAWCCLQHPKGTWNQPGQKQFTPKWFCEWSLGQAVHGSSCQRRGFS